MICPRSGAMRAAPGHRIREDNPGQRAVGFSAQRRRVGQTAMTGRAILVLDRMAGKPGNEK